MRFLKKYFPWIFGFLVVVGGLGVWSCKKNARALTLKNIFGWWLLHLMYPEAGASVSASSGLATVVDDNGLVVDDSEGVPLVKSDSSYIDAK